MFIGHFAVGFAAKRAAPKTSLGWLVAAPAFADLLWPIFLLLGWERARIDPSPPTPFLALVLEHYPISHSLVALVGWALLGAGIYWAATRYAPGALWIGIGVLSHWLLDFVTHRPDLPIAPGDDTRMGLGLWYSVPGTLLLEGVLFAWGVWLYAKTTRPRDGVGRWAFFAFVGFLVSVYAASAFSPTPPPNARAVAFLTLSGWLLPFWAAWFDRHRDVVGVRAGPSPA
jgi:membrane-bound metal-dependent hydrolase YbcI (DUF457 family)